MQKAERCVRCKTVLNHDETKCWRACDVGLEPAPQLLQDPDTFTYAMGVVDPVGELVPDQMVRDGNYFHRTVGEWKQWLREQIDMGTYEARYGRPMIKAAWMEAQRVLNEQVSQALDARTPRRVHEHTDPYCCK